MEVQSFNKDGSIGKRPHIVYTCRKCLELHTQKNVQVDHIEPIGSTPELANEEWGTWIAKLFVSFDRLQVLCLTCHKAKTKLERGKNVPKIRRHKQSTKASSGKSNSLDESKLEQ